MRARGNWSRLPVRVVALVVLFAVLLGARLLVPDLSEPAGTLAALGFLLLGGGLMAEVADAFRLPHLSGYLLCGIIAGPHAFDVIEHRSVERLVGINELALALIALAGGAELRASALIRGLRSQAWAAVLQSVAVGGTVAIVFVLAAKLIPFAGTLPPRALWAVAALWAVVALSRSPAAVLGVLAQTRARGPITDFTLTFVMASDVLVVALLAGTIAVVRVTLDPTSGLSLEDLRSVSVEILGGVALGTSLGLFLAAYLHLVGRHLLLLVLALGLSLSEVLHYLRFDPLMTYIVAGFVVRNLSRQGDALLRGIETLGGLVFVVFFATAGARLDLDAVRELWPAALLLATARLSATWIAARIASAVARDPPLVRRFGWSGLVSQAGLTLGLAVVVGREFADFGAGFAALAVAVVSINEMIGPVLFKAALDRSGESRDGTAGDDPQHRAGHPT